MLIASFVAMLVVLCGSGAGPQGRTPVLSGGAVSFLSASGTSVVGFPSSTPNPAQVCELPRTSRFRGTPLSAPARIYRALPGAPHIWTRETDGCDSTARVTRLSRASESTRRERALAPGATGQEATRQPFGTFAVWASSTWARGDQHMHHATRCSVDSGSR